MKKKQQLLYAYYIFFEINIFIVENINVPI